MAWKYSYKQAANTTLMLDLPAVWSMKAYRPHPSAVSYIIHLKQGEKLVAEVDKPDSVLFFLEVFDATTQTQPQLRAELKKEENRLQWIATKDDSVRISLQPMLHDTSVYDIKVYKQPAFTFPVAGKGNSAMQSFWGADRDGGARSHEGIDIFAPRGTPVVAAGDGRLGFTGEKGLGGRQVWLYENETGFSIYYAHLDSIAATSGAVLRGDTLGYVGNTGNAAGGATHLHFGIYGRGGAVNPLHFIRQLDVPAFKKFNVDSVITRDSGTKLRRGPGKPFQSLATLEKTAALRVQANFGNWLQVMSRDSVTGFIPD